MTQPLLTLEERPSAALCHSLAHFILLSSPPAGSPSACSKRAEAVVLQRGLKHQAAATRGRVLVAEYTVCLQSAYTRSYLAVWCSSRRWLVPVGFRCESQGRDITAGMCNSLAAAC